MTDEKTVEVPARFLGDLTQKLAEMETLMARRFDEVSMEINATSQQMDFAESEIGKRFAEILDVIQAVSFSGAGNTAANTGVELEVVVQETEKAANRILDAVERISDALDQNRAALETAADPETVGNIYGDLQTIVMACEFQDITGQRITNTVDNLRKVETRLSETLSKMGIEKTDFPSTEEEKVSDALESDTATQDDIDKLFD